MTVESVTYISDLNPSYPAAGDDKREGDDHIRNGKTALRNTFPNVTGAVTPTHTTLNLVGVTQAQSSNDTSPASTAFVHTAVTAAAVAATIPTVIGDAGQLMGTDGTTPDWTDSIKATVMRFVDGTDATKKLAFGLSGLTTATTRTVTIPDKSGTMAMTSDGATQAQMEAASASTVFATPGNVNWHPGVAKVWIKAAGDGTSILASHNVTSITDTGTGILTVTVATDFGSAEYAIVASLVGAGSSTGRCYVESPAAGTFILNSYNAAGAAADPTAYCAVCYGDQA